MDGSPTPGGVLRILTSSFTDTDQTPKGDLDASCLPRADCYAQYLECYQQCRQLPVPQDFNQYIHDFGPRAGHDRYCSEKCMPKYAECLKTQGHRAQEFTTAGSAVDWLKRHRESVLVGSLVVIAGVTFVTVSAGAGVVVLAPLVLVTSSAVPIASNIAAAVP